MTTLLMPPHESNAYKPERLAGSVVSYPSRCQLWGEAGFHGNCDGRLFKSLVELYKPKSVADPMFGSGTTRDVIDGMNRHCNANIKFWGNDLRFGFNLQRDPLPGRFDLVWLHPPYWNIVRYSDKPADLSTCEDYQEFLKRLRGCLRRCHDALNPGGRLAVLFADVRRRGVYYPLVRDVLAMEGTIGQLRSVIIKMQHNCRSDSKTYNAIEDARISHEYCAVFKRAANESGRAWR